jgi:hypothetical protein
MKLCTNNKTCVNITTGYDDKTIAEVETPKFLGLRINNTFNWKTHTECIIPQLSSACFVMWTVTSLMKMKTLKLVYFAYFHSTMSHRIIFWGNSTDSKKVFYMQKKIITTLTGTKMRASCIKLFMKFNHLPPPSKFLLSLSSVVDNIEKFQTQISAIYIKADTISTCQILTSVNIKEEFTILELCYSVIFHLL